MAVDVRLTSAQLQVLSREQTEVRITSAQLQVMTRDQAEVRTTQAFLQVMFSYTNLDEPLPRPAKRTIQIINQ